MFWYLRRGRPVTVKRADKPTRPRRLRFEALEQRLALAASPSVTISGNTLNVNGTGNELIEVYFPYDTGYEFFVAVGGQTYGGFEVGSGSTLMNGMHQIDNVEILGLPEGQQTPNSEQFVLYDSIDNYTMAAYSEYSTFSGSNDLNISAAGCPYQTYYGTALSTVNFYDENDTTQGNSFVGTSIGAYMYYGSHAETVAYGPDTFTANASNTSKDVAYFYEPANGTLACTPTATAAAWTYNNPDGAGVLQVNQTANDFGTVLAIGQQASTNTAIFTGASSGTNTFVGTQYYSYMSGEGYFDVAEFFGSTVGYAKSNNDFAYLYAPTSIATVFQNGWYQDPVTNATDTNVTWTAEGSDVTSQNYIYITHDFHTVLAVGSQNVSDTAALEDNTGENQFFGNGSYAYMEQVTAGVNISATDFSKVTALSEKGSADYKHVNSVDYSLQFINGGENDWM